MCRMKTVMFIYMQYAYMYINVGRDSIVGIMISYGLGVPGIESRWGLDSDRRWGSPATCTMGNGSVPRSKAVGAWR